jgi:hypothetical protein
MSWWKCIHIHVCAIEYASTNIRMCVYIYIHIYAYIHKMYDYVYAVYIFTHMNLCTKSDHNLMLCK